MRRFALSVFAVVAFLPTVANAQLFPRLFGGKSTSQVGSACPGGVCPTAAPASTYRSVGVSAAIAAPMKAIQNRAGHWSYPGDIDSHLEGTHGVSTAGMTHAQKLDLHDSLHEGTRGVAAYRAIRTEAEYRGNYPAVASSVGYGSSGVRLSGYGSSGSRVGLGSSGSLVVGTVLPDGAVVTSVGVTVPAKVGCGCGCPNCTCGQAVEKAFASPAGAQLRIGERAALVRVMLKAARDAKASGATTEEIKLAMVDAAVGELAGSNQAIDIDKWIEIIEKLIPLIMRLIELFSQAPQAAIEQFNAARFVSWRSEELPPLTI